MKWPSLIEKTEICCVYKEKEVEPQHLTYSLSVEVKAMAIRGYQRLSTTPGFVKSTKTRLLNWQQLQNRNGSFVTNIMKTLKTKKKWKMLLFLDGHILPHQKYFKYF